MAVVTSDGGPPAPYANFPPVAYTGCLLSSGRERLLARYEFQSLDEGTGVTEAAVAGNYAALASFQTDYHYGGSSDSVAVYDLQTGEPLTSLGGETIGCGDYSCFTGVNDLAINSQGFTAAHMTINSFGKPDEVSDEAIQVSDSAGVRTLDSAASSSGEPILTDLVLSGDTLSWKHGGTLESAQLH